MQYLEEQSAKMFTPDNLPVIMHFLNKCKHIPTQFTGDTDFKTIVVAAKFDGQEEFIQNIIKQINS